MMDKFEFEQACIRSYKGLGVMVDSCKEVNHVGVRTNLQDAMLLLTLFLLILVVWTAIIAAISK